MEREKRREEREKEKGRSYSGDLIIKNINFEASPIYSIIIGN
jgi:hypothetical protein